MVFEIERIVDNIEDENLRDKGWKSRVRVFKHVCAPSRG
jgi:hypothetical protein